MINDESTRGSIVHYMENVMKIDRQFRLLLTIACIQWTLLVAAGNAAHAATFPFSTFDRLQGLIVYDIAEDDHGNIWLGTESGVWRWHLNGFEPVVSPTGTNSGSTVPSGWARGAISLACGSDRTLWIGTGRGLLALNMNSLEPKTVPAKLREARINRVRRLDDGTVWACTADGLFEVTAAAGKADLAAAESLAGMNVQDIARSGSVLWVATSQDVREFSPEGVRLHLAEEIHGHTATIYAASDGSVWIGTRLYPGLYRYADGHMRTFHESDGLTNKEVNCIAEGARGEIWIGTERGAFLWRDGRFQEIDRRRGLEQDDVHAILIDHEAQTWIGTFGGGAYLLRSADVLVYNGGDGLEDPFVSGICRFDENRLLVSSMQGLSRIDLTTETARTLNVDRLSRIVCEDGAGRHWTGGQRTIRCLELSKSWELDAGVIHISRGYGEDVLVGTDSGLLAIRDGRQHPLKTPEQLGSRIICSTIDDAGRLLVGGDRGLAFRNSADDDPWTFIPTPEMVVQIGRSPTGEVWIGTSHSIEKISPAPGDRELIVRGTGYVHTIVFEPGGVIWAGAETGLYRIDSAGVRLMTTSDGLPSPAVRALYLFNPTTLFVGTTSGLARIDLQRIEFDDQPPRVQVELWSTGGTRSLGADGLLSISADDQGLIAFIYPVGRRDTIGMQYRIRIEGAEDAWSDWSVDSSRRLPRLRPGQFAVTVQGRNSNGVIGPESRVSFEVRAPFWQSPGFLTTAGVVSISGLFGAAFLVRRRAHFLRRIERSERRFRTLVESMRAIPYELDAESGEFGYVGPRSESITGFSAENWEKPEFMSRQIPEEDLQAIRSAWHDARTLDQEVALEHRLLAMNGETLWLKHIVSPPEPGGSSRLLHGLMVDVTAEHRIVSGERAMREELEKAVQVRTAELVAANETLRAEMNERRRIDDELKSSEERFALIFDASPMAMILSRLSDGVVLSINDAFLGEWGYSRDEVIGKSVVEIKGWHSPESRKKFIDALVKSGGVVDRELELAPKSGAPRLFRLSARMLQIGGEWCVLSVADDVTERRAAEREVEEQREFLRQLIDLNPNIIFAKDSSLRYTLANRAIADFFGTTPDQIVGRLDSELNPDLNETERYNSVDREVIEKRREIVVPVEKVTDARGVAHYFQTIKLPLISGDKVGLLGVATDITERREAEIKLRDAHEALRAANEQLEERVRERTRDLEETKTFLQQVLETSPALIFVKDAEGRLLFGNQALIDLYAIPWEQMVGRKVSEFHPAADCADSYEKGDAEVMTTMRPLISVERFRNAAGQDMWFKVVKTPFPRPNGEVQIMGIATNITDQIRVEAELRENVERLQLIARGASDGLWDATVLPNLPWNSPSTPVFYSERFKALLGFSDEEFPNYLKSWAELLHPEDRSRVYEALTNHLEHKAPYEIEYRLRTKSDGYRWFQARGQAIWNDQGRPTRMAGSLNDITRRKADEQQLRRQALVFDNMYDGVLLTDPAGTITDWNQGAERLFGYSRDEILGQSPELLNREGEGRKISEMIRSSLGSDGLWSGELRIKRKDGSEGICDVRVVQLLDQAGCPIGSVSFNRDITERKRAEEQSKLFTDIVNHMQTGLYVWQPQYSNGESKLRLVSVNPAGSLYSNQPRERLMGAILSEEFPGLLRDRTKEICEEVLRTQRVHELGRIDVDASGDKPARVLTALAFALPNRCVGIAFEDISAQAAAEAERNEAEAQRNQMAEQLLQTQKLEAVGTLASGIAHDFRDLLTTISTYADIARSSLAEDHPAVRTLLKVETTAQHAQGVTNALLTFSRRASVQKSHINLSELITESMVLLRRLLPRQIEIESQIVSEMPLWILADETQITQVLVNLVNNAGDAIHGSGRILISLSSAELKLPDPTGDDGAPFTHAILTVTDSGKGIRDDVRDRIFEPFFTTKQKGKGTGLGLSITRGIIENIGGRIQAESEAGKGTTIRIEIPCCPPKAEPAPPSRRRTRATDSIVVVMERHPQVRSIITTSLRVLGCEVQPTTRVKEAIEVVRSHQPNARVLIVDLDGFTRDELVQLGRVRDDCKNLQLVVVVGTLAVDLQRLPMDRCFLIRKPFEMPELSELVGACLAKSQKEKGPSDAE